MPKGEFQQRTLQKCKVVDHQARQWLKHLAPEGSYCGAADI